MILALLLCIGAISTILHNRLEVEFAWPTEKSSKLHFNLGFAALLMFAIQVAIGGLRCHGRKLRRCFSTFHLFVGLASYIVSRMYHSLNFTGHLYFYFFKRKLFHANPMKEFLKNYSFISN